MLYSQPAENSTDIYRTIIKAAYENVLYRDCAKQMKKYKNI